MEELKKYKFIDKIKALPFVKEVWIFGSRARGDSQERSDIDIAVLCKEYASDADWRKVQDIAEDADTLLMIDLVRFDKLKDDKFRDRILRDKKVWE